MAIANTVKPYVNADGLMVKFPQSEMALGKAGEQTTDGNVRIMEIKLSWNELKLGTSDTNPYVLDFNNYLPANSRVEYIDWVVTTAWAGASGTYNLGIVKQSDLSTIIDADGYIVALTVATLSAPGVYRVVLAPSNVGTNTFGGTLLDTVSGNDNAVFCVNWNTTIPSAGDGSLRIAYRYPSVL